MGKNIQHAGKISHINVYPYDVPFIVTIRVDAIKNRCCSDICQGSCGVT